MLARVNCVVLRDVPCICTVAKCSAAKLTRMILGRMESRGRSLSSMARWLNTSPSNSSWAANSSPL
jgi:hypothetical protein